MKIYAITLGRTPNRFLAFQRDNSAISNVQRFDAVDGTGVDRDALMDQGLFDHAAKYSDGAVGCALSHLALWNRAIELNEAITIVEDDAVLNYRFRELADEMIGRMRPDWDFVLWGWNFDSILEFEVLPGISETVGQFNQGRMRENVADFVTANVRPMSFPLHRAFGTVAYSVSVAGANKLATMCFPIVPLTVAFPLVSPVVPNNGIDIAMNSIYSHINAFVSFPPLAITRNDHGESTVL